MDLKEILTTHREYLHQIPELGFCEFKTSAYLKEQLELNVANLITQNKIELNCSKDELIKKLSSIENQVESSSNRRDFRDELSNYQMLNDQCIYMFQTIPTLVKKKVIR